MSPSALIKDARLWIAMAMLTVVSLIMVWWFWYVLEAWRAVALVTVEDDVVMVDGIRIDDVNMQERKGEFHGTWRFFEASRQEDVHVPAMAMSSWNSYDAGDVLVPFRVAPIYHRLVASLTSKTRREPELYQWEDQMTYPRVSAVWRFGHCHIEIVAAEGNDSDIVRIAVIAAPMNWDAALPDHRRRRSVQRIEAPDVERFLSTLRR